MNPETRRMLEEVYAQDDLARAEFERHQRQMKQRSGDDSGLVFKTHEARPMQQQAAVMNDETARQWNEWARAHIDAFRREVLTPAIGQVISEIRREFTERINGVIDVIAEETGAENRELRAETDRLRTEVTELKAIIDGKVMPLRGQRDVDAA